MLIRLTYLKIHPLSSYLKNHCSSIFIKLYRPFTSARPRQATRAQRTGHTQSEDFIELNEALNSCSSANAFLLFSFPFVPFPFFFFFFTAIVNIDRLSCSQELSQGCRSASARCLVVKRCDYVEARTPEVSNAVYTRETGLLISPGTFVGQSERFFFAVALRVSSHSRDGSFSRVGRPLFSLVPCIDQPSNRSS